MPMPINSIKEVIEVNMPGFTAEDSLHRTDARYRTDARFLTGVSDIFRVFDAGVTPQLICHFDGGNLICGDEPFGGTPNFGGDHSYAQCRARCYLTKRGAALRECLRDC